MSIQSLRIATFNIRHAQGKSGAADIRATAEVIKSLDADLIAVQELDVNLRRSHGVNQPAELAELLGMHVYFAPALELDQGEYGIALVSRDEFRGAVERLPRVDDEEPRVAIVAGWNKIGIVTTHLSRSRAARKVQTEAIAEIASKLGTPTMVLGDLNQAARELAPLRAKGFTPVKPKTSLMTTLRQRRQIDHILVSGGLAVISASSIPTSASDHPVVVAELTRGT